MSWRSRSMVRLATSNLTSLKAALTEGRLKTRKDVTREVTRILNDESLRKPRILQFFREFFDYV